MSLCKSVQCSEELDLIYRGSTPEFSFDVCLDTSLVDKDNTHIVFTSGSGVVDKTGDDITYGEGTMSVLLNSDDTLSFTGSQVNIQILVTMTNGRKPPSEIMVLPVKNSLRGDKGW